MTVPNPEQALCHYCGKPGAGVTVGSGNVVGVAAHLECWLESA